jgi:flagellar FliJ protein
MKKFNFKFESILNVRSHKVNLAKEDLAKVIKEKVKRLDIINTYLIEIDDLLKRQSYDVLFLQARNERIEHLKRLIANIEREIKNIEEIENVRRKKLADLLKDEKIMEKLKEKDFDLFKEEYKKQENNFIDEIANQRAFKK